MAMIWLISDSPTLPPTLAPYLQPLGGFASGPPERSHWKDVQSPDLVVLAAADASAQDLSGLEQMLGFVRGVPQPHRAPAPILYIEPPGGRPPAALVASLIDDRPVRTVRWPLDPDQILNQAQSLLAAVAGTPSLRERARREWVARQVELFYASLDLPALRHAIDPRNAHRPVLLVGEPGTRKGLLARYIHTLAEPAREELVLIPAPSLESGRMEARLLQLLGRGRVTAYLDGLGGLDRLRQDEIASILGESGLFGAESIRWVASASAGREIPGRLRALPWLRVELPPLRERADLEPLARSLTKRWGERTSQERTLAPDALDVLGAYAWPGNLQELESALEMSLTASSGPILEAGAVHIVPGLPWAVPAQTPPPEPSPTPVPSASETHEGPAPEVRAAEVLDRGATRAGKPMDREPEPDLSEILKPLAPEIRQPLLAIRTCLNLLDQRPDDDALRRNLSSLVEDDLSRVEELLGRLERFAGFSVPQPVPLDLPALILSELERREVQMRARSLVVLKELDKESPPVLADAEQLRFVVGSLLDRILRMVPSGGDLYLGSHHHPLEEPLPARHRLLIRFHSPEDVLVGSEDDIEGRRLPLEMLMARALVLRMNGAFAADSSGAQDNVILIELPT